MAKIDTIGSWKTNDFEDYFSSSHRFGGSSETFLKLREQLAELKELDSMPVTRELAEGRRLLLEMIQETSAKYVSDHGKAWTSQGKERLEVAQALEQFCKSEIPLMKAEKKVQYFKGKSFDDIRRGIDTNELDLLSDQLKEIQNQPMTEANVIKYTNTLSKYIPMADAYLDDERTKHQPMKQAMQTQIDHYKSAIGQMRDFRNVKRLIKENKGWNELNALREAKVIWNQPLEKTGENSSERIKLNYEGRKGFFTKETFDYEHRKQIKDSILNEGNTKDIITLLNLHDVMTSISESLDVGGQNSTRGSIAQSIYSLYEKESDGPNREVLGKMLLSSDFRSNILKAVDKSWGDALKADPSKHKEISDKFLKSIDKAFPATDRNRTGLTPEVINYLADHLDTLIEIKTPVKQSYNEATQLYTEKALLVKKVLFQPGSKEYEAITELEHNSDLLKKATEITINADRIQFSRTAGNLSKDTVNEYSRRNVATTRIAELLGIGDLIAHSEQMTVIMNGKEQKGCFMEFAEGVDPASRSGEPLEMLAETQFKRNSSYNRAESQLEMFDLICGQMDRHGKNFFYKLSEKQADGSRNVIGIQAIDNDLSFHLSKDLSSPGHGVKEDNLIFVDKELAENITKLDHEKIEYVFSDVLTKEEIEAFESRVEALKEHIKTKAVIIDKDGWELNEFDESQYKDLSNLDIRTQKYIQGLRDFKDYDHGIKQWDRIHKAGHINEYLREAKEAFKDQKLKAERSTRADDIFKKIAAQRDNSKSESKIEKQNTPLENERRNSIRTSFSAMQEQKVQKKLSDVKEEMKTPRNRFLGPKGK